MYTLKLPGIDRGRQRVKLPASLETAEQQAFFARVRMFEGRYPQLACVFAIPNQGVSARVQNPKTGKWYSLAGQKRQAEGVRAGVPDVFCAVPISQDYDDMMVTTWEHGLFLEFKRRGEKPKPEQVVMMDRLEDQGYRCEVVYDAEHAWKVLAEYLGLPRELLGIG